MATATSLRCCNAELDNGICKEKIVSTEVENQEESDFSDHGRAGKPPRNRPVIHHSISQATLTGTCILVSGSLFAVQWFVLFLLYGVFQAKILERKIDKDNSDFMLI